MYCKDCGCMMNDPKVIGVTVEYTCSNCRLTCIVVDDAYYYTEEGEENGS
jgi:hypothetical protein